MHPGRGLRAWEAASLVSAEVRATVCKYSFGKHHKLADQLMRAANSIGANIAEGCWRETKPDRLHYYRMARSSAAETMHHLKDSYKAKLIPQKTYYQLNNRATVTLKLISALIREEGG